MQAAIATILKKKYAIPLVFTEHSSGINVDKIGREERYFGNIAYKYADKIIAVSSSLAKRIKQHFNVKSVVVHNVLDVSHFNKICKKKEAVTFVSVGNLIKGKGYDLLIEAFHECKFNKNVSLLIIGEGGERKYLEKQIKELGLTEQIELLGLLSRKSIQEQLSKSTAFVLASRSETFGVVYIEAMATGLPVIATRCGGPEDFVDKTNGLLIEPNDVEGLKTALIDMCQNANRYDATHIRKNALENFSPASIAKKITKVYEEIKE
jgi:glycosyltransferase involved in cell wall biosynthesis